MSKKITNYSYQRWIFICVAIVVFGFAGVFAAKKLMMRSTETLSAKFDRIIGLGLTSFESPAVESKIDDLVSAVIKEAKLADDDRQFSKLLFRQNWLSSKSHVFLAWSMFAPRM